MAEREAETAANSIRDSILRVIDMFGVGFLNYKGTQVDIIEPSHRLDNITYFTICANINPHLVDTRAPDSIYLFEFPLSFRHTFPSSSEFLSVGTFVQTNTTPASVDTFDSTLSKIY